MRRRLFNLLAGVSLLLCVATAVMWVGGFRIRLGNVWNETSPVDRARWSASINPGSPTLHVGEVTPSNGPAEVLERFAGFSYIHMDAASTVSGRNVPVGVYRGVVVPLWFILLMALILPASWMTARARSGRRGRLGLCPACGYDLRATPDRCPECGAVPTKSEGRSGGPAGGGPVRSG